MPGPAGASLPKVSIDEANGTVTINGVTYTAAEAGALVAKEAPIIVRDTKAVWEDLSRRSNWNIKNVERVALYAATFITTSNVFGQIPLPTNLRIGFASAAAFVLAAIHVSTPKA